MALTINQSDLFRFERLVAKLSKPSEPPVVIFIPCARGSTKLAAFAKDAVLTMPVPSQGTANPFTLDWRDFKELAAKKNTDVLFDVQQKEVRVQYDGAGCWFSLGSILRIRGTLFVWLFVIWCPTKAWNF